MIVGVVGFGVVGKTLTEVFRRKGYVVYVNDAKDIQNEENHHKSFLKETCDVIFVCVPTPCDVHGMDLSYVEKAVADLNHQPTINNPVIAIKSTVTPGTTRRLQKKYPELKLVFNPEFLRQNYAINDFLYPSRILIGTDNLEYASPLLKAYASWKLTPKIVTDTVTAELVKLVSNALLVHKVAFASEIGKIAEVYGVNADSIMKYVVLDGRFHPSHLTPSLGKISSKSPCLPKDLTALIHDLESHGYESELLRSIRKTGIKM